MTIERTDLHDFVGLGLVGGRLPHPLGRVDLVHGLLHARIRVHVGHEGLQDLVPVLLHHGFELTFHSESNILFSAKV